MDALYPEVASHGELAGIGALFAFFLREDGRRFDQVLGCLRRHGLPTTPAELGVDEEQFLAALMHAPSTRPDRYTILEYLALDREAMGQRLAAFLLRTEPVAPRPAVAGAELAIEARC
jgi:glycerol-1-phosphate dehydrogenase [NAD(P)+]